MKHAAKGPQQFALANRTSAATGIANGLALAVGVWCTIASMWLLLH